MAPAGGLVQGTVPICGGSLQYVSGFRVLGFTLLHTSCELEAASGSEACDAMQQSWPCPCPQAAIAVQMGNTTQPDRAVSAARDAGSFVTCSLAPRSSSLATTSARPFTAASCRGVQPASVCRQNQAFITQCPTAASCRGVQPASVCKQNQAFITQRPGGARVGDH